MHTLEPIVLFNMSIVTYMTRFTAVETLCMSVYEANEHTIVLFF